MGFRQDFRDTFQKEFGVGQDQVHQALYTAREKKGESSDSTRPAQMSGTYRPGQALNALLGREDPVYAAAREQHDIGFKVNTPGQKAGTALGALAGDLVQDKSRRWYWLVNAPQATGDMIAEATIARSRPRKEGISNEQIMNIKDQKELDELAPDLGLYDKVPDFERQKVNSKTGEYMFDRETEEPIYETKNLHGPGWIQLAAAPAGIAINTGIGLMSPLGGAEGYKAVLPSDEDPAKTSNVIGEVAAKYIMGRTGDLLPWDDFKKVRPDVSKDEYMRYKAFKWDKEMDLNPLDDGQMTAPMGALKWTDEGIHGPELQFLGKGIPLTTGIIPFASAMGGASLGVSRLGPRRGVFGYDKPIRRGAAGGVTGLIAGEIVGSLLEQERRRRNAAENELNGPQY